MRWQHRADGYVWAVPDPDEDLTFEQAVRQADEHGCERLDLEALQETLVDGEPRAVAVLGPASADGRLTVEVSDDGLTAVLHVEPPGARQPRLSHDDVDRALRDAGVRLGVDRNLLATLRLDRPGSYQVASGWPPTEGRPGFLEYEVSVDHELRHRVREDGSVDFHSVARMPNVRAGQLLAVLVPPLPGVPGRDVHGEVIEAPAGEPAVFPEGDNVWVSDDGTRLHAGIDGLLEIVGEKVSVRPDLVIEGDVDFSTGSIDFAGDVIVHGSVLPDFFVTATGKVVVLGDVDHARIDASTMVWIRGALVGDRARVRCNGNVKIGTVREGRVEAGDSVVVEHETLGAEILAGVRLVLPSSRNRLAGGVVHAGVEVIAGEIGSIAGIPTEITIGRSPQEVELLALLTAELREHSTVLERVLATTTPLRQEPERIAELQGRRREAADRLLELEASLRRRVGEIADRLRQLDRPELDEQPGRVVARQVMRRSVRVRSGADVVTTTRDQFRVVATRVNGRLTVVPLAQQPAAEPAPAAPLAQPSWAIRG